MFESFFKTCVATVSDAEELDRIKDSLSAADISYECRMKDLNRRNAFDQGRTGSLGIQPKFVTEILVDKKDTEVAMHIVRTMMFSLEKQEVLTGDEKN